MEASINKLSISAAKLLQQKDILSPSEFQMKMETILSNLANITSGKTINISKEVGFMEKMSFEIRTPMNSILGFTGLLKDSYFTMEEKDEFIGLIEQNTEQLVELLSDLTELTKIDNFQINLRMEKFELNIFLLDVLSEFNDANKNKSVQLSKKINKDLPQDVCIYTDPYQLNKIVHILLNNLSKLNDQVSIQIKANIINNHFLEVKVVSDQLELPETLSRGIKKQISEIKEQRNFDGTGLKLTITKALVDLLNGKIEFNTVKPKGSEFVVRIPVKICSIN